jgi:hypothetical protein
MKKMTLFKLFVIVLLCFVGFGFYRGWFVLSSRGGNGDNKVDINLTVDPDKAKEDAKKVGGESQ